MPIKIYQNFGITDDYGGSALNLDKIGFVETTICAITFSYPLVLLLLFLFSSHKKSLLSSRAPVAPFVLARTPPPLFFAV